MKYSLIFLLLSLLAHNASASESQMSNITKECRKAGAINPPCYSKHRARIETQLSGLLKSITAEYPAKAKSISETQSKWSGFVESWCPEEASMQGAIGKAQFDACWLGHATKRIEALNEVYCSEAECP